MKISLAYVMLAYVSQYHTRGSTVGLNLITGVMWPSAAQLIIYLPLLTQIVPQLFLQLLTTIAAQ